MDQLRVREKPVGESIPYPDDGAASPLRGCCGQPGVSPNTSAGWLRGRRRPEPSGGMSQPTTIRFPDFRERFDRLRRGQSLDDLGPAVAEVVDGPTPAATALAEDPSKASGDGS